MITKTSEAENGIENRKNRTKTGQNSPKTSADFWKKKVKARPGLRNGLLYVRLFEGGREAWVCCDSSNRAQAAVTARDRWLRMKAIGLPALLAELSPDPLPERCGTVGELIEAASKVAQVRPATLLDYGKRLRQVAADVGEIRRPEKITSRTDPATMEWRRRVDALPLDILTASAVAEWRAKRIAAAGADPIARKSAEVSADSAIRMARSLFSPDLLTLGLAKAVRLPDPLPFAGLRWGETTKRFECRVNPALLFVNARRDLESEHPQSFRALALCLLAGLRRVEADLLTWDQVDLAAGTITVRRTPYMEPKSREACRVINLDTTAVAILREAKSDAPDPVFVLKGAPFKPRTSATPVYRADAAPFRTWERLIAWLATKGIDGPKPIHDLRKLAGSMVHLAYGIEQARDFLGHQSVLTTSASYLSQTPKVMVSIPLLADEVSKAQADRMEASR